MSSKDGKWSSTTSIERPGYPRRIEFSYHNWKSCLLVLKYNVDPRPDGNQLHVCTHDRVLSAQAELNDEP